MTVLDPLQNSEIGSSSVRCIYCGAVLFTKVAQANDPIVLFIFQPFISKINVKNYLHYVLIL